MQPAERESFFFLKMHCKGCNIEMCNQVKFDELDMRKSQHVTEQLVFNDKYKYFSIINGKISQDQH